MKKAIAILLAAAMAFTLIACNSKETPQSSAPPESPPASAPAPATPAAGGGKIGYLTDEVDHFARDPFKIGYICISMGSPFIKAIVDSLEAYGKVLNYSFYAYDADHDYEAYMNQMSTFADQGYDGLVLGTDDAMTMRAYELAREFNLGFIAESTAFLDASGKCIWPSVAQDQYGNGATCMNWLVQNYTKYWNGPIDTAKVGLIVLTFSPVSGIDDRRPGVHDAYVKAFPDSADNYYIGDLVTTPSGFSVAGGDELVSGIIPANPHIENWFIVGLVDDWALGATRAVERLGKGDCTLIVSVQADSFIADLDSGGTGDIYVAACAISSAEFAGFMAAGLVAMLDGRAAAENLWPEWQAFSGEYAYIRLLGDMITKDNYKEWMSSTDLDAMIASVPG